MSGAPSKCLLWFNGQKFDHCTCYGALGVNHDIPHTSLKANEGVLGNVGVFPFMLSMSKHVNDFFNRLFTFDLSIPFVLIGVHGTTVTDSVPTCFLSCHLS